MTSLPFVNYGGVLADSDARRRARLRDAAAEEARARRCRHVELRHIDASGSPTCPASSTRSRCVCRSEPELWERLDRKVRNQIRKAEKSGLTVGRRRR